MRTVEMDAVREAEAEEVETLDSGPAPRPLATRQVIALVAAGGALGATLRFIAAAVFPTTATPTLVEIPWSTLAVNVIGCLILGALTGVMEVRPVPAWTKPLIGTGFCGGFTTMSAVVLDGSAMVGADFPTVALTYALLTLAICIGATVVGLALAMRLARPDAGDTAPADEATDGPAWGLHPGAVLEVEEDGR